MSDSLPTGFTLTREAMRWPMLSDLGPFVASLALHQPTIRVYGRECRTPRLVAWYGEAGYSYSGQTHPPLAMPPWLEALRNSVESVTRVRFNSVLANYYRDGRDSVAWHADDEPELGSEPMIASVSLGASREFAIKPRARADARRWRVMLDHGDLLLMRGRSQLDYLHALPKTSKPVGPRLNLTFRQSRA